MYLKLSMWCRLIYVPQTIYVMPTNLCVQNYECLHVILCCPNSVTKKNHLMLSVTPLISIDVIECLEVLKMPVYPRLRSHVLLSLVSKSPLNQLVKVFFVKGKEKGIQPLSNSSNFLLPHNSISTVFEFEFDWNIHG